MTYQQALELLKSFHIEEGHDWDRHCIGVGEIAYKLALALKDATGIDAEEVRLLGLVHDFGRCVSQCPYRHSYEGYRLFKGMGEDTLARICSCHSNGTFRHEDLTEYGLIPEDFYVKTLGEKLVFIADNLECHGTMVRQDKRLAEVMERYKKTNPEFIPILQSKFKEFMAFDEEIKRLCGRGVYDILGIA